MDDIRQVYTENEEYDAKHHRKDGGGTQILCCLLYGYLACHQRNAQSPRQEVEHGDIHCKVDNAVISVDALHQGNANIAAIRENEGHTLNFHSPSLFRHEKKD